MSSTVVAQEYKDPLFFLPMAAPPVAGIDGVERHVLDGPIALRDNRLIELDKLGIMGSMVGDESVTYFLLPEDPAVGIAMSNPNGGEDTFICCWWYLPE